MDLCKLADAIEHICATNGPGARDSSFALWEVVTDSSENVAAVCTALREKAKPLTLSALRQLLEIAKVADTGEIFETLVLNAVDCEPPERGEVYRLADAIWQGLCL